MTGEPSRPRALAGVFVAYVVLSAVVTFPLVFHPTDHVVGESKPPGEATPPLNIWAMATVLHHLPWEPLELFEGTAFYPYQHTLAFSEHLFVPALMAAPVVLLTGNWVLAYNVVMLLTLATAGFGMFLLARELTGDEGASFAAGLLYAFHTWNINELVRSQITANQWFPFVLLALVRFFATPSMRGAIGVGLAYALQSRSCMYWALYLPFLVAGASLFLWWKHRHPWRALLPLAASLGVAGMLTGLFAIPYFETARSLGFERPAPPSVPIDRYWQVLPESVLYGNLLGRALRNQNAAHFLGFVGMGLGLVGFLKRRAAGVRAAALAPFLIGLAAAGFLFSLGPEIQWGDRTLGPGPYALLRQFVPGFRNVRYPERLSVFLVLGLCPLVAMGMTALRPRLRRTGVLALTALLFFEHLAVPQELWPMPAGSGIPSVYRWLAERKDVNAVADLPASRIWMERADAMPMYLTTVHWKRHVQGYTSYFGPTYNFIKWRLFHFPDDASVWFLARFGVDTLVVSPEGGSLPPWATTDPRWELVGPFPEGHAALRLKGAGGQSFTAPPDDAGRFREIDRSAWQVQASHPEGAALAVDGDPRTAWTTQNEQGQGDFYRIRLGKPARVARIVMALRSPFCFPMHFKILGETAPQEWDELPFDEAATFDRLFASLLHEPRNATLTIDLEPRELRAVRVRITDTDAFWMPWTMSEIRLYERR